MAETKPAQAGDAVLLGVEDADAAELELRERAAGSMRMEAQMERKMRCRDSYARCVLSRRE